MYVTDVADARFLSYFVIAIKLLSELVSKQYLYYNSIVARYPANTQRFQILLESCAELVWDKRYSNLVATFDQIYFVWQ